MKHTCYMECGSIINSATGSIIERPAILIDKSDSCLHGWGNIENVQAKFNKFVDKCSQAGNTEMANDMVLIELSEYKIDREMACYILRRVTEYAATSFTKDFYKELTKGKNPVIWLKSEMERLPIDLNEQFCGTGYY